MKSLTQHITEKLVINRNNKVINYHPKTRDELKELVDKLIEERGNEADLNDIYTSEITDMNWIFDYSKFNGDISNWDVSNVMSMEGMFFCSEFNGNLSKWNVSKVKHMAWMFYDSEFNGDITEWDVSKVEDMKHMFEKSKFNMNISKWEPKENCAVYDIFKDCSIKEEYKPKGIK